MRNRGLLGLLCSIMLLCLVGCGSIQDELGIGDLISDTSFFDRPIVEVITNTVEALEAENKLNENNLILEKKENDSTIAYNDLLEVHFIDVGQGDATLVKLGEHALLIDAGDNDSGTKVRNYLKNQGVTNLDYFILTHPDADHIGGAASVISNVSVHNLFMSEFTKDNKTYDKLLNEIHFKSLSWSMPEVGSLFSFGEATIEIIGPDKIYSDPNNSSIALVLIYGENRFLFTGDAEEESEEAISQRNIDVDVYQVGHHGSKTSSSQLLLDAATPTFAVISSGEDNSYGHPHAATLNSLRERGIQVFRTDEQGSVVATSDGKNISWNCEPFDAWTP